MRRVKAVARFLGVFAPYPLFLIPNEAFRIWLMMAGLPAWSVCYLVYMFPDRLDRR